MKFLLLQLNNMNYTKPLVQVDDTEEYIQWDYCDLEGLPTKMEGVSMTSHGKIPRGQRDNLPEVFEDMNGVEHRIEDIHELKPS